jgi:AcrR family transcriptional regulator
MPRNAEDARKRMRHAAVELFAEHGFDQTTAAQIAARAGVTERTFFRHFPDKREVLFEGQEILGTALSEAIAKAPAALSPIETLHRAFAAVTGLFEANRQFSEPRQRIISATPALQEREVAKHAAMARTVAVALQRRGVERPRADLAAQAGLAVLGYALACWFADPSLRLSDHLDRAFAELQDLSSPIERR